MDQLTEDVVVFTRSETYGPILKKILEHEDKVLSEGGWHKDGSGYDGKPMGWGFYEVGVMPGYLTRLVHTGILSVVYKSNRHTDYRLTDPDMVRRALAGQISQSAGNGMTVDEDIDYATAVSDLFEPIIGYEDVKDLFLRALESDRPVHMALIGPPASAKSLFLLELGRLPRAYFVVGGGSSKAGLTEMLLTYRPRYLLLDEIETVDSVRDYSVLLHLMENQEVIETKFKRHSRVPLKTWVFAAGNDDTVLPPALLSRFGGPKGIVRFREYRVAEFLDVAARILVKREALSEDFARTVAESCIDLGTMDVRLAIRFGRLARDAEGLKQVVETMRRRR